MTGLRDALPNDVETLKAMLLAERARAERLAQIIKELQRHRFGRRAETLPLDQLELGLEDVQQAEAALDAKKEKADPAARSEKARQRRANRGALPAHLPRIEVVVDVESKVEPPRVCRRLIYLSPTRRSAGPQAVHSGRLRPRRVECCRWARVGGGC